VLVSADEQGHGVVEREVDLAAYFTGYRASVRRRDELIRTVRIPLSTAGGSSADRTGASGSSIMGFHKIAKRRFDDISSVAVAFALDIQDGVIASARIGLGGVAATPLRAYATERALVGRPWDADTVEAASVVLQREGTPLDDHRASAAYRARMLGTALPALFAATRADEVEATA